MTAEQSLHVALATAPGVVAIVADRVYPDQVPESAATPAIAYERTNTVFLNTIHGGAPLGAEVTLEVTCVHGTRIAANALASAVVQAMAGTDFYGVDQQSVAEIDQDLWGAIVIVNFNE